MADTFTVTVGINSVSDRKPCLASSAYPLSGIGRTFFIWAGARF